MRRTNRLGRVTATNLGPTPRIAPEKYSKSKIKEYFGLSENPHMPYKSRQLDDCRSALESRFRVQPYSLIVPVSRKR